MNNELMDVNSKTQTDRVIMHVLYALHTLAWFSAGALAILALIFNYIRRDDESSAMYKAHHDFMIATFWWTLLWLVVLSPLWLLLVLPGAIAYFVVWLWYLYRCLKGWVRFNSQRMP